MSDADELAELRDRRARALKALREAPDVLVDGYNRRDDYSRGEVRKLVAALARAYYALEDVPPSRRGRRMEDASA